MLSVAVGISRWKTRSTAFDGGWRTGLSVTSGPEITTPCTPGRPRRASSPGSTKRDRLGLAKSRVGTAFQARGST